MAGYLLLRLAWRGFYRPCRARVVTAAMRASEARRSRSARRGGKRARGPGLLTLSIGDAVSRVQ